MIADQNFYDIFFMFLYPTASATAYGWRPKFVRAEHSATAEGENCAYSPTLCFLDPALDFKQRAKKYQTVGGWKFQWGVGPHSIVVTWKIILFFDHFWSQASRENKTTLVPFRICLQHQIIHKTTTKSTKYLHKPPLKLISWLVMSL